MFKQVKSAIFWYYLYKFRRRVIIVSFLLLISLFSNAMYSDIVQYLTLKDKLQYLEIVIISKWFIIIFNLLLSIYLIIGIFKGNEKEEIKIDKKENSKDSLNKKKNVKSEKDFTSREKKFLNKDLLNNEADILIKR
ncbi:MAG: hypothetical protein GY932_12665 [Arcobacter sp.]|nr:hypothetical protein [Arcobacter sp.]